MASTPESKFAAKIKKIFDKMILEEGLPLYYFIKEAGSIRGIPDIVGSANGRFFSWEIKPTRHEAEKTSGRIVLQKYTLLRIERSKGIARMVHPENLAECILELRHILAQEQSFGIECEAEVV